ncbi:ABC transporter substrate-binding protein [Cypionkella sp.]|uniref:ABC transporter substrate-binding protein n=1 Tax=Cypionkella sp. TaxID=2811411 RepID=UPI0026151610|nr:ABC transporter substrate-binding protein [Cypionkella sp.]
MAALPTPFALGWGKGSITQIAKQRGEFEKNLAAQDIKVEWVGPFPNHAPSLQAVVGGSADFGFWGSTTPALAAILAGSPLVFTQFLIYAPRSTAIIVKKDSGINSVKDLVGKRVAVNRSGLGEFLVVAALEKNGVPRDAVEFVYLNPPDAAPAFGQGKVDAWSMWSPGVDIARQQFDAKDIFFEGTDLDFLIDYSSLVTQRKFAEENDDLVRARANAAAWASHVGVPVINGETLARFRADAEDHRTLYTLDVRDPAEYAAGHPAGFVSAPGGQLVQATDEWLGVRGARVVLYDDDAVRARMAASWLLQMGWDVHVLEQSADLPSDFLHPKAAQVALPQGPFVTPAELAELPDATVIDLARAATYGRGHVPGAWFASGPELARDVRDTAGDGPIVLTSPDGAVAAANLAVAQRATTRPVLLLQGGTDAWRAAGLPVEIESRHLSQPFDAYKRPYEGTDNAREKMEGYIAWELKLVAQLANDGVARFHVVRAK